MNKHLQLFRSFILIITLFFHCTEKNLRGKPLPSKDGKTYLIIENDDGGECTLFLDGRKWNYPKNKPGLVSPGKHVLKCWIDVTFLIEEGTTFHFDYWGP